MYEVHARCTVVPHFVTGREVAEVRWTGSEGMGSTLSFQNATYIEQWCVVTWDRIRHRETLYVTQLYIMLTFI